MNVRTVSLARLRAGYSPRGFAVVLGATALALFEQNQGWLALVIGAVVVYVLRPRSDFDATVRTFLGVMTDAVIVTDGHSRVRAMNPMAERLTGWTASEVRGRCIEDILRLVDDGSRSLAANPLRAVLGGNEPAPSAPYTLLTRDGGERRVAVSGVPIRDGSGAVSAAMLILGDQTAEHALRESDRLFRLALEHSPIMVFEQDRELRYTKLFNVIRGFTEDAVLGSKDEDLLPPADAARRTALKRRVLESGVAAREEMRAVINGRLCFHDLRVEPLRDGEGRIVGVIGTSIDVTDRKEAEEALRASETKLRRLLDSSIIGVVFWNLQGEIVEANDLFLSMIGYTRDDLRVEGLSWRRITPPEYAAADDEAIRQLQATGRCEPFEKEYLRKDGGRVSILIGAALLEGSKDTGSSFVMDITARKRAETELRAHKDELHRAHQILDSHLQNSPLAVVEWDRELRVIRWVGQAEKLFGWTAAEVLHKRVEEWRFVHDEDGNFVASIMRDLTSGDVPRNLSTSRNYTRDGSVIQCEWYNSALRDDGGQVVSILSLVHDVTERRRAEQALRELSGRLLLLQDEERRRIARELHDTTAQNLSALAINLELLERAAPPEGVHFRRLVDDCRQLVAGTMQEVRTLSYLLHPPLLDDFGLASAVRHYADGFSRRSGIRVEVDMPADDERLSEDVEMALFRVLQESLGNVHRHSSSPVARIRLTRDDQHVCLEIGDEGRGLPQGLIGATGFVEVASGVGLLGMKERVRQLGGRMELETDLPGVLVRAILPIKQPVR